MRIPATRVWRRRAGRARGALITIGATVLVLAAAVGATVGALDRSSAGGIRVSLASSAATVTVSAPIAEHPSEQDAAIRHRITVAFAGIPITLEHTTASARTRWTIAPVASRIDAGHLARLEQALRTIGPQLEADSAAVSPAVRVSGDGAATVASVRRGLAALGAIAPVPEGVLALSGLIALVLARGALTEVRRNETRLLRSRGGSVRGIVALDSRESFIVCLVGTALGSASALGVDLVVFGSTPNLLAAVLPAGVVLGGSLAVNVVASWLEVRGTTGAPRESSGRRRAIASGTALAFAVAVTAIATWRFLTAAQSGADFAQDPAAVLAPAALLCVTMVVGLIAVLRVAVTIEHRLAPGRDVHRMLPLRDTDRRVPLMVGPAALLALALASATIAGSYGATWSRYLSDSQSLTAGAPVGAELGGATLLSDRGELIDLAPYRHVEGVTTAVPVSRESDQFSDTAVTVVGVRASELGRLQPPGSTVVDTARLAASLAPADPAGILLPDGAHALTLSVVTTAHPAPAGSGEVLYDDNGTPIPPPPPSTEPDTVLGTVWLSDSVGSLVPVVLSAAEVSLTGSRAPVEVSAALPLGGPWTMIALDVLLQSPQAISDFAFQVTGITASTPGGDRAVSLPTAAWAPIDTVFGDGSSHSISGQAMSVGRDQAPAAAEGGLDVRLMPTSDSPVPIVISRPFALANGLNPGSRVELDGAWSSFHGVVRQVVELVPGATSGDSLIADLVALNAGRLRTSEQVQAVHEIWIGTSHPDAVASRLANAVPSARITRAADSGGTDFTRIAVPVLWIGAAGALIFAWIAVWSATWAMLRRRRTESRVLRALGVRASRQARWRRAEFAGVTAAGLLVGLLAGGVTTIVAVAPLARLATPTAPLFVTARLMTDAAPIAGSAVVLAAGAATLIALYGRRVRREAAE